MTYRACWEAQAYFPGGIVWRIVASAHVFRGSGRHARRLSGIINDCLAAGEPMKRTWTIVGVADVRKIARDINEEACDHVRALMDTPEFEQSSNARKKVEQTNCVARRK